MVLNTTQHTAKNIQQFHAKVKNRIKHEELVKTRSTSNSLESSLWKPIENLVSLPKLLMFLDNNSVRIIRLDQSLL